jgi:hypothetical protein
MSLFVFSTALALDEDEIYKFEPCYDFRDKLGQPPQISPSLAHQLSSPKNFPLWGTPLGPYVRALERHQSRLNQDCDLANGTVLTPFPPLLRSVSMVASNTAELIRRDLEYQKRDMLTLAECLRKQGDVHCDKISRFLASDLSERLKKMRLYMALKDGPYTPGTPLKHDLPYTQFISGLFFSAHKNWKEQQPPLSSEELAVLAESSRSLPEGRTAADLYDQMVSTTPILLLLDEPLSTAKLADAVDVLLKGYPKSFSFEGLGQEIFLQTPYVAQAISQLPKEDHYNACLVTKAVFRNLKIQYESIPRSLAGLALVASIPTGALGAGARVFFQRLMSRSAWSLSGLTAAQVATLSRRYLNGMKYCSALYRQKNPAPEVDGLCSFGKTSKLHSDAEISILVNAGILGAVKASPYILNFASKNR